MQLAVEGELVVDLTVEMDGQLGNARQRLIDAYQHVRQRPIGIGDDQAAGNTQVAVEPGVQQGAAIDLDADLAVPGPAGVGSGLDPEVRAVGVSASEPHGGPGWRTLGSLPGNERTITLDEPATRHVVPWFGFGTLSEPGRLEPTGRRGHRVMR